MIYLFVVVLSRIAKGEIVKDILCNWLMLRQNALYL